jgi:hypothetical protein
MNCEEKENVWSHNTNCLIEVVTKEGIAVTFFILVLWNKK